MCVSAMTRFVYFTLPEVFCLKNLPLTEHQTFDHVLGRCHTSKMKNSHFLFNLPPELAIIFFRKSFRRNWLNPTKFNCTIQVLPEMTISRDYFCHEHIDQDLSSVSCNFPLLWLPPYGKIGKFNYVFWNLTYQLL